MNKRILTSLGITLTALHLTSCSSVSMPASQGSVKAPQASSASGYNTPLWAGNASDIWTRLQHTPSSRLAALQNETADPVKNAWIQLALISKQKNINTQQLAGELLAWRSRNPSHPANQLLPDDGTLSQMENLPRPRQVAVLLPMTGAYSASGKAVREGFLNSYYSNIPKIGRQEIKFYDTASSQNMQALFQQAFNEGADFIIGPLLKENVQQMSASTFTIPVLALNYTDIRGSSLPANFYEYGLLPEDEAAQIADRAHEAGLSRAIVIAPQNAWGQRLASAFITRWQTLGGRVQDSWYFSNHADFNQDVARLLRINPSSDKKLAQKNNHRNVLAQQRRQDFDVIFLFTQSGDSHAIVPLLRYYYAGDVPIYASSAVYSGKPNPARDVDLNGVIICDIPWSMQIARGGINPGAQSDRLYAVGQDAYLLSQSLQRLKDLPNFPMYGTTGAMMLTSNNQIHRRMPCVPMRNGLI